MTQSKLIAGLIGLLGTRTRRVVVAVGILAFIAVGIVFHVNGWPIGLVAYVAMLAGFIGLVVWGERRGSG